MTPDRLRAVLSGPASLTAIRVAAASGELAALLPTPFFEHIASVYARLEATIERPSADWPLKLAVLVHEEPPAHAAALLAHAGFGDVSDRVGRILRRFGDVWKLRTHEELMAFVRAAGGDLAAVLRFELAHEGAATPLMMRAAEAAGLGEDFRAWRERLVLAA